MPIKNLADTQEESRKKENFQTFIKNYEEMEDEDFVGTFDLILKGIKNGDLGLIPNYGKLFFTFLLIEEEGLLKGRIQNTENLEEFFLKDFEKTIEKSDDKISLNHVQHISPSIENKITIRFKGFNKKFYEAVHTFNEKLYLRKNFPYLVNFSEEKHKKYPNLSEFSNLLDSPEPFLYYFNSKRVCGLIISLNNKGRKEIFQKLLHRNYPEETEFFKSLLQELEGQLTQEPEKLSVSSSILIKFVHTLKEYLKTEAPLPSTEEKEDTSLKKIRINQIQISQIKCFENVSIEFSTSGRVFLIIGPNGRGKSSILQLIALGLSGIRNVPFPYNWHQVIKKGSDQGEFSLKILFDNKPLELKFSIDNNDSITCLTGEEELKQIQDRFLLLAYGSNRTIKLEETQPFKEIESIATLFGENGYLKHIKVSTHYEYVRENFDSIQQLINRVLEGADTENKVFLEKFDTKSFYFLSPSNPDTPIPIEALSEGFKSTFGWLFDAIIRMVEKGGNPENAHEIPGIILIDEIDLHIHPTWQRTILPSIESVFPNMHLIVTTHSPFVVQSVKKENLISLKLNQNNNSVEAINSDVTSELSYNAISREIFQIQSPFSYEIEQKMKEFRKLENAIEQDKDFDQKEFEQLVLEIAEQGPELEGVMRRSIRSLELKTGKTFAL